MSVLLRDLNGDGAPDIYVCNDADSPDRIWLNDGAGHFRALPKLAFRHTSLSSMGVDCADLNRDGFDDLFVLDMLARRHEKRHTQLEKSRPPYLAPGDIDSRPQYSRNTLQLESRRRHLRGNRLSLPASRRRIGPGARCSSTWTSTVTRIVLVVNGFHREVEDIDVADRMRAIKASRKVSPQEELQMRSLFGRWETPNLAFRNRGDLTFEEVGKAWGFDWVGVSQGIVSGGSRQRRRPGCRREQSQWPGLPLPQRQRRRRESPCA